MFAFEGVLNQLPRSPRVCDSGIKLCDLSLRELIPGRAPPFPRREQPTDLREGEARVLVKANERDPL